MQSRIPSLLPLLRSTTQGELLAWLYLHPEGADSLTELADRLGVSVSTVHREANRLLAAGLIREHRVGRTRLLSANTSTPLYEPLTQVLALTFGPLPVLTALLRHVPGITHAYLFGSWAARYSGEPGRPPRDIDILVVGEADADELFDIGQRAAQRLGREVNLHQVSHVAWAATDAPDPFLASVRNRPLVRIDLDGAQE